MSKLMESVPWTMTPTFGDVKSPKLSKINEDIRAWERGFELEHRRAPTRADVLSRPFIVQLYVERYHLEEAFATPVVPSVSIGRSTAAINGAITSVGGDTQPIEQTQSTATDFFAEDSSFADYFGVLPAVPVINRSVSAHITEIVSHEESADMEVYEAPAPHFRRPLSVLMNQRAKSPIFADESSNSSNADTKSHPSSSSIDNQAQTTQKGSSAPSLSSSLDSISFDEDLDLHGNEDPTETMPEQAEADTEANEDDNDISPITDLEHTQDSAYSINSADADRLETHSDYMDMDATHASLPGFWSSGPSLADSLRASNALEIIEDDRARFSFDDQLDEDDEDGLDETTFGKRANSTSTTTRFTNKKTSAGSSKPSKFSITSKGGNSTATSKKRKRATSGIDDANDDMVEGDGSGTKRPKLKTSEPIIVLDELSCASAPEVSASQKMSSFDLPMPEMSNPPTMSSTASSSFAAPTTASSKRQNFRKINLKGGYKKTRMDRDSIQLARSRKAAANAQARSAGTQDESPFDCWDESTMELMLQPQISSNAPNSISGLASDASSALGPSFGNTSNSVATYSSATCTGANAIQTLQLGRQDAFPQSLVSGPATLELRRAVAAAGSSTSISESTISEDMLTRALSENFPKLAGFREGQKEAISRVLSGQPTLLILPTGGGKSLCYQLPALTFERGLTMVVSPLLSLISDQLSKLPPGLVGVSLGSNLSNSALEVSLEKLKSGNARVLFVSPEKLASQSFLAMMKRLELPIELLCVDEAHCLSTWSHNFRPSYLSIYRNAVEILGARRVLALTATATAVTAQSICESLHIPSESILRYAPLGEHIELQLKMVNEKHDVLERILKSPELSCPGSVIIYVMFQKQADDLASYLQNRGFSTAAYHAGKSSQERARVQTLFHTHKVKIIVATVAFGMGIDQQDVRGVIHFCMPKSVENYVQEVGRAGRDGLPAHCYLLCHPSDLQTLRSFAHADTQDRSTIKALLLAIWPGNHVQENREAKRLVALKINESERTFDIKQSLTSTVLTWLANDGRIELLAQQNSSCELSFHEKSLELLKTKSKLMKQCADIGTKSKSNLIVPLDVLANERKESIEEVTRKLAELAEKCGVATVFRDPAMCMTIQQELFDQALDEEIDAVYNKIRLLESVALEKIDSLHRILTTDLDRSIHSKLQQYFTKQPITAGAPYIEPIPVPQSQLTLLQADVNIFLKQQGDAISSARQVARIFHGIGSPQFPKEEWQLNRMWGKSVTIPFEAILKVAQEQILARLLAGDDY